MSPEERIDKLGVEIAVRFAVAHEDEIVKVLLPAEARNLVTGIHGMGIRDII